MKKISVSILTTLALVLLQFQGIAPGSAFASTTGCEEVGAQLDNFQRDESSAPLASNAEFLCQMECQQILDLYSSHQFGGMRELFDSLSQLYKNCLSERPGAIGPDSPVSVACITALENLNLNYQPNARRMDVIHSCGSGYVFGACDSKIRSLTGYVEVKVIDTTSAAFNDLSNCIAAADQQPGSSQTLERTPTPSIYWPQGVTWRVDDTPRVVVGTWDAGYTTKIQWLRDGTPIGDATHAEYKLQAQDFGRDISVQVTGSKPRFGSTTLVSNPIPVTQMVAVNVREHPMVFGYPEVGQTLKTRVDTSDPGVIYGYQWMRGSQEIEGATGPNYTLIDQDFSTYISLRVTASKDGYYDLQMPKMVAYITESLKRTPVPQITGSNKVGDTLTAVVGQWDEGVSTPIMWMRDESPIFPLELGSTYVIQPKDAGRKIMFLVRGSSLCCSDVTMYSEQISISNMKMKASKVQISGVAKIGKTLTATTTSWAPSATSTYQWLLDGKAINGAVSKTLKLTSAHKERKVSVKVTQSATGFDSANATSSGVKVK